MLSTQASDILGVCILAALACALVAWVIVLLRRSPFTPIQSILYAYNYTVTRVLWRTQIRGRFPIPDGKGAVIVCNHRSSLDPSFIAVTVLRVVHWMVAREYFSNPVLGRLLRKCGAIPVNRGAYDTAATKAAIRMAEQGGLIGLFPEARINTTKDLLLPGRSGAAMIALKARVPVVPCYIQNAPYDGTAVGCLLMPASVKLTIGEPIDLSEYYDRSGDREVLDEVTLRLLKEIALLAGDSAFQPQVAGRASAKDASAKE